MKLLITGFEAFGEHDINPSAVIAEDFNGKVIQNIEVIGRTVPLNYAKIKLINWKYIEKFNPDIIMNLGQAPRPAISLEYIAINVANVSSGAYNCGAQPKNERIVEDGPAAYFSLLPTQDMVNHLNKNNIPCYISYSAGTFGCNQIFYTTMNYLDIHTQNGSTLAGFIHIPLLPEQTIKSPQSSSMSLDDMKRSIELLIDFFNSYNA
ncbi:MAG: pyroglutamyl-peptidase I family protein [Candidatus Hodarchaeales archaeon]